MLPSWAHLSSSHRFLIRFPKHFLFDLCAHSWMSAKFPTTRSSFITQEGVIETVNSVLNFDLLGENKTKLVFSRLLEGWSWDPWSTEEKIVYVTWHQLSYTCREFLLRNWKPWILITHWSQAQYPLVLEWSLTAKEQDANMHWSASPLSAQSLKVQRCSTSHIFKPNVFYRKLRYRKILFRYIIYTIIKL